MIEKAEQLLPILPEMRKITIENQILLNKSELYYRQQKFVDGLLICEKSLAILRENEYRRNELIEFDRMMVANLSLLVAYYLKLDHVEKIPIILKEIGNYSLNSQIHYNRTILGIDRCKYLIRASGITNLATAYQELKGIMEGENARTGERLQVIDLLLQILILELKLNDNPNITTKIDQLLNYIDSIAKKEELVEYKILCLLHKAKVKTVMKDYDSALELLDQASVIADQKGLPIHNMMIKNTEISFMKEIQQFFEIIRENEKAFAKMHEIFNHMVSKPN